MLSRKYFITVLTLVALLSGCGGSSSSNSQTENKAETTQRTLNFVTNCGKEEIQGYSISWCHEYLPESTSRDVIYYFHGLDGSEKSWSIHTLRQALRYDYFKTVPQVVGISFGPRWFMSDVAGWNKPSRLDVFTKEFFPRIQQKLNLQPARQIVMGESMGGFNALALARAMPKTFDKVVAICPAVMAYSPFWSGKAKDAYLDAHPFMDGSMIWKLGIFVMLYEFHTPNEWNRNNPLLQAQAGSYDLPPLLLSVNERDQFAFDDGTRQFASALEKQDHKPILVEESGTHCVHGPKLYKEIADFTGL